MPLEFDPINKLIKILSGTSSPLQALTIYSQAMDWADSQAAIGYSVPMNAVGKAPLGGGVYTDSIFTLQSGWKIKLYSGTYQFVIVGTVITDDETTRTVPPDSGNVEVIFQVSSQGVISIPVISTQEKQDIAKEVWDETRGVEVKSMIVQNLQIDSGRWKIQNNQMLFYGSGDSPLLTFNLLDKAGQPSEVNVYERVPV